MQYGRIVHFFYSEFHLTCEWIHFSYLWCRQSWTKLGGVLWFLLGCPGRIAVGTLSSFSIWGCCSALVSVAHRYCPTRAVSKQDPSQFPNCHCSSWGVTTASLDTPQRLPALLRLHTVSHVSRVLLSRDRRQQSNTNTGIGGRVSVSGLLSFRGNMVLSTKAKDI